jgi:uncharacterized repeat protein (TIGR01451 family)
MRRNYRLAGYLLAAALLVWLMAHGPQAWATPGQTSAAQSFPTRTPKPQPNEPEPTSTPPPPPMPSPTPSPTPMLTPAPADAVVTAAQLNLRSGPGTTFGTITVLAKGDSLDVIGQSENCAWLQVRASGGIEGWVAHSLGGTQYTSLNIPCDSVAKVVASTPSPRPQPTVPASTATPTASGAALSLAIRANPNEVWADQPVEYTLALVNRSAGPIRNIVLLDPLPADLDPGAIISGAEASWQDRTLRVEKEELAPGERLEIVFQAIVGTKLPPGTAIVNRASASMAGGLETSASTTIAMPPPELPRVGGIRHGEH